MHVADIMTSAPVTIEQGASVSRAFQLMLENEYQQLPVLSENGHLVGIIHQRDCRCALGLPEPNAISCDDDIPIPARVAPAKTLWVHHYMQPAPIVVEPETPAHEAARLMTTHHVRALPVMRGETLVGIVTVSDLLIAFMRLLRQSDAQAEKRDGNRRWRLA
ncbi:MAG: CBS domain-containing protein [Anaerolineae bacterium]|nr:CBS domain-containing protein [Anaerolineae bacterium]